MQCAVFLLQRAQSLTRPFKFESVYSHEGLFFPRLPSWGGTFTPYDPWLRVGLGESLQEALRIDRVQYSIYKELVLILRAWLQTWLGTGSKCWGNDLWHLHELHAWRGWVVDLWTPSSILHLSTPLGSLESERCQLAHSTSLAPCCGTCAHAILVNKHDILWLWGSLSWAVSENMKNQILLPRRRCLITLSPSHSHITH